MAQNGNKRHPPQNGHAIHNETRYHTCTRGGGEESQLVGAQRADTHQLRAINNRIYIQLPIAMDACSENQE